MDDILQQVMILQKENNLNLRNDFIKQYQPFIVTTISKCTGMYIRSEESDEFAVGQEAFNEAIDKYIANKGSFIAFAGLVIRSRVKDYLRKEYKYQGAVELNEELLMRTASKSDEDLAAEVRSFKTALQHFDISMETLIDEAPKHKKTKREIIELGNDISEDAMITHRLYTTKKMPMAMIMKRFHASKKRLKTYRNYIIGIVVINIEKLDQMKAYTIVKGEGEE